MGRSPTPSICTGERLPPMALRGRALEGAGAALSPVALVPTPRPAAPVLVVADALPVAVRPAGVRAGPFRPARPAGSAASSRRRKYARSFARLREEAR